MTKPKTTNEPVAKKVAPKNPVAKKAPAKKATEININDVELVSYSMEMTIPTGQYANIKPKIEVRAYSMDKAHDFIAPHMNKLWKEYYLVNERRPEPVKAPVATAPVATTPVATTPAATAPSSSTTIATDKVVTYLKDNKPAAADTRPLTIEEIESKLKGMTTEEIFPSPASSVAYSKATQAIESCMSLDALEIIRAQVDKSVKLTQEDKEKLQPLLMERLEKISNGF